jgi:hypothetical protein
MDSNPFNNTIHWIWSSEGLGQPRPGSERSRFRTRYFRRAFNGPPGAKLRVHVSADTVYRFWCNGVEVAYGPAKGDVEHHFYDTVELTPLLKNGSNVIAAQVSYYGDVWAEVWGGGPVSRMTAVPGFILAGNLESADGKVLEALHSDKNWRVLSDTAYQQVENPVAHWLGNTEALDCSAFPWGFNQAGFDDSAWSPATPTVAGVSPAHVLYAVSPHRLVPRMIAPLERSEPRLFQRVCRGGTDAQRSQLDGLLARKGSLRLEPGTRLTALIDVNELTTGFPHLEFTGGAGATIKLTYAEAGHGSDGRKSNRADTSGTMRGYYDVVRPDGPERSWEPFTWRTFRYIELDIEVKDQALELKDLNYIFSAYPFEECARYESSDTTHKSVWEICWRTARLCAHETYEDCPYYEQLQYGGDTQIQAMISYYVAGDASLARQWLYQYDWSRTPDGLTRSRYPARVTQTIPFWSLHWAMAVLDYWQYTGDVDSVRELFPGVLAVMDYFDRRRNSNGLVGKLSGWQCADWCPQWKGKHEEVGVPPGTLAGHSAFVNLMTAVTLDHAAKLAQVLGRDATELLRRSSELKAVVQKLFYEPAQNIYWDTPDRNIASAYTNVWALLAKMPCNASDLAERIVTDKSLCQLTMFSNYFAYRALAKVGRYDLAPHLLAPWLKMPEWGLTTCPEIPDYAATRSDCHAWSAGPLVEFCREILGVRPAKPGYGAIQIVPKPAGLTFARGRVPLTRLSGSMPAKFVDVAWEISGKRIKLDATVPDGISCEIVLPDGSRKTVERGGQCTLEADALQG